MIYHSLNHLSKPVDFERAVLNGIASDRGLYFPSEIKTLPNKIINEIEKLSINEISYYSIKNFIGKSIPKNKLISIIDETLSFNFPLVKIDENIFSLELFHGPTLAFKDVGARFMARSLGYFNRNSSNIITVLVATSGDTGGAVADGFYNVPGIRVVILYPKDKVSKIQKQQMTSLGKNIITLEVDGVFDDCQEYVKSAFLDEQIKKSCKLTSANSINVARWLPQMFYYFSAYKNSKKINRPITFSVPSGNFGNLCAGLMAKKIGLPIEKFLACTNLNNSVPRYLNSGIYAPNPTIQTISNAMDVGNPSNFLRIQKIYNNDVNKLKKDVLGFSFNDKQTRKTIKKVNKKLKYILDPHGAIGYMGLKELFKTEEKGIGIFLETAHPIKFAETIEKTINTKLKIPKNISLLNETIDSISISNFDDLKDFLLKN